MEITSIVIGRIKFSVKLDSKSISIFCSEEDDAITTLANLFSGMSSNSAQAKRADSIQIYRDLRNGIPYMSEGFWMRKFDSNNLSAFPDVLAYKTAWENSNGHPLTEPIWLCANNWNGAKRFLTASEMLAIIDFAFQPFKHGRNFRSPKIPFPR